MLRDLDRVRIWLAQPQHVQLEVLPREEPRCVEHRAIEVLLERHRTGLELAHHLVMTMLEILLDAELLERLRPLLAIPPVGAEDAADVEEDVREVQIALP